MNDRNFDVLFDLELPDEELTSFIVNFGTRYIWWIERKLLSQSREFNWCTHHDAYEDVLFSGFRKEPLKNGNGYIIKAEIWHYNGRSYSEPPFDKYNWPMIVVGPSSHPATSFCLEAPATVWDATDIFTSAITEELFYLMTGDEYWPWDDEELDKEVAEALKETLGETIVNEIIKQ